MTILFLIIVTIICFFLYDKNKQSNKIKIEGGMINKYKTIIDHFTTGHSDARIHNSTSDSIDFGVSNYGGSTMYYLTQTFGEINIKWKLNNPVFGEHELNWDFPEYENQNKIINVMINDLEKYQKTLLPDEVELPNNFTEETIEGNESVTIKNLQKYKNAEGEICIKIKTTKTKVHLTCYFDFAIYDFEKIVGTNFKVASDNLNIFVGGKFSYDYISNNIDYSNLPSNYSFDENGVRYNESITLSSFALSDIESNPSLYIKFNEYPSGSISLEEEILNVGPGGPGETTRALTKIYLTIDDDDCELNNNEKCQIILQMRSDNYLELGYDIINEEMRSVVLARAKDRLPFIIFADVFLSNNHFTSNNGNAIIENLDLIIKIIVSNYNSMVPTYDRLEYINILKVDIKSYLENEFNYSLN